MMTDTSNIINVISFSSAVWVRVCCCPTQTPSDGVEDIRSTLCIPGRSITGCVHSWSCYVSDNDENIPGPRGLGHAAGKGQMNV